MHFVSGSGQLLHDDGAVTDIAPGVIISLRAGWTGEWNVVQAIRKVYVIYRDPAADGKAGL